MESMLLCTDRRIVPPFASTYEGVANLSKRGTSAVALALMLLRSHRLAPIKKDVQLPGGGDLCVFRSGVDNTALAGAWCASLDGVVHRRLLKSTGGVDSAIPPNQHSSTAPPRIGWSPRHPLSGPDLSASCRCCPPKESYPVHELCNYSPPSLTFSRMLSAFVSFVESADSFL